MLGLSWQPEIAERGMAATEAEAGIARMRDALGLAIEVEYCPHGGGPPMCWCRKPLPGLGMLFVRRHRLDPRRCVYVAAGPQDAGFARRLGFTHREPDDFFAAGV